MPSARRLWCTAVTPESAAKGVQPRKAKMSGCILRSTREVTGPEEMPGHNKFGGRRRDLPGGAATSGNENQLVGAGESPRRGTGCGLHGAGQCLAGGAGSESGGCHPLDKDDYQQQQVSRGIWPWLMMARPEALLGIGVLPKAI